MVTIQDSTVRRGRQRRYHPWTHPLEYTGHCRAVASYLGLPRCLMSRFGTRNAKKRRPPVAALCTVLVALAATGAGAQVSTDPSLGGWDLGFELKGSYRDSEELAFPLNFPFSAAQLPPGQEQGLLETVDEGVHTELSTVTLRAGKRFRWGEVLLRVDLEQLHDRNPTSTGHEVDVDEAWIRFGRETPPALLPERVGAYLKLGKFPAYERQDDRHLESYGLVSTAFNRQEDVGLEVGFDLGRHAYFKGSFTQGNPIFMRDPNALAGDNGTPDFTRPNPDPKYRSGILIYYDADLADLDFENPEVSAALGLRFANLDGRNGIDLLVWGRERSLADTVDLYGTFYGGDLDLLLGPANRFPFPVSGTDKSEYGANLWLYAGGVSFFAQYVDQEVAELPRTGIEAELAWTFDLPLGWSVGGRQLFPYIAPAIRYSKLDPDFTIPAVTPSPSFGWDWKKWDAGIRLGIVRGVDVTAEVANNEFYLASGESREYSEVLVTVRYRFARLQ